MNLLYICGCETVVSETAVSQVGLVYGRYVGASAATIGNYSVRLLSYGLFL